MGISIIVRERLRNRAHNGWGPGGGSSGVLYVLVQFDGLIFLHLGRGLDEHSLPPSFSSSLFFFFFLCQKVGGGGGGARAPPAPPPPPPLPPALCSFEGLLITIWIFTVRGADRKTVKIQIVIRSPSKLQTEPRPSVYITWHDINIYTFIGKLSITSY